MNSANSVFLKWNIFADQYKIFLLFEYCKGNNFKETGHLFSRLQSRGRQETYYLIFEPMERGS